MPTTTATTVRVRNGATVTTDGPFAETKEQLGGFYILECADLDEAKANEALKRAEEARAKAQDKQEIAAVEGELAMLAAQLAAIRRLRKK